MHDNLPLVSIVTPNYNYANFISETIESVLNQDYSKIEYIIVDDGSTDNSVEVIQTYVIRNPEKIKLIQQVNMGQTPAINAGLREVKGDIVGWINSDDLYYDNNAISAIVNGFKDNPDCDIIFGDYRLINEEGKTIKYVKQLEMDRVMGACIGFGILSSSNTVFWKSGLFKTVGYLKEDLIYNMDGEYWSRLMLAGKAKHIPVFIADFRWHTNAKTVKNQGVNVTPRFRFEFEYEIKRSYSKL